MEASAVRTRRYRVDESGILNPGVLRHQLLWQVKTVSGTNSTGEDVYDWNQTFVEVRGQVKSLEGRELEMVQQRFAEARYGIIHPWVPGLTTKMRILWIDPSGYEHVLDVLDVSDSPSIRGYTTVVAKDYV